MFDRTAHTSRRSYLKAAGVVGLAGFAGCLGDDDDLPTVTTSYVVPAGNKPSHFLIDHVQDEIAENAGVEYELEVEHIGSTPEHVGQVAAGEVQVGMSTVGSLPSAIIEEAVEGGVSTVAVDYEDGSPDHYSIGAWVPEDSDVETAADLEGMTIAINAEGTGVHAIGVRELANHGLSEDDVDWVEFPFPSIQSALEEGQADTGILPSTFGGTLRLDGGYRFIFDSHDAFGTSYPFTYLFAANDWIDDNEDVLEAFLEDYAALVDYNTDPDNRDDVVQGLVDEFDASEELYDHMMYNEYDYYHPNPPELDADGLQVAVDDLADMGFLAEQVDMAPHVDNSYLP